MTKLQSELGSVTISEDVIGIICGVAASNSYGLVGMASRNLSEGIGDLLRRDYYDRGVDVDYDDTDTISVTLHIVVQYGVKISEVARNIQEQVKYAIEDTLGLQVNEINVYVRGVRVADGKR